MFFVIKWNEKSEKILNQTKMKNDGCCELFPSASKRNRAGKPALHFIYLPASFKTFYHGYRFTCRWHCRQVGYIIAIGVAHYLILIIILFDE